MDEAFAVNLAKGVNVKASEYRGNDETYNGAKVTDENADTYWTTDDGVVSGSLELDLGREKTIHYVLLQEYIRLGQRVKRFHVEVWQNGNWKEIAAGTTIGYKRILKLDPVSTPKIKITIDDARACALISTIGVY